MNEESKMLKDQFKRNHPNIPVYAIPSKKKAKSETNELQNNIIKFLKLKGQFAEQIQTKGTHRKGIGYTAGNYTKGSADIHALLWSESKELIVWKIEVKTRKDIQSEDQLKYQFNIEQFGGKSPKAKVIYSIVKTFDDFINQYNLLIK